MSEEEKQAIKWLENTDFKTDRKKDTNATETLLSLLEKQQKEIEELKQDYQILKDDMEGHRVAYIDTPEFEEKFISKDKIKAKMQEIISYTYNNEEEKLRQEYAYDRLKELLGEENE